MVVKPHERSDINFILWFSSSSKPNMYWNDKPTIQSKYSTYSQLGVSQEVHWIIEFLLDFTPSMYLFVNDTDTQCSVFLLDLLMEILCAHILSQMSQLKWEPDCRFASHDSSCIRDSMLIKLLEKKITSVKRLFEKLGIS